jgi:hypothetical protein
VCRAETAARQNGDGEWRLWTHFRGWNDGLIGDHRGDWFSVFLFFGSVHAVRFRIDGEAMVWLDREVFDLPEVVLVAFLNHYEMNAG